MKKIYLDYAAATPMSESCLRAMQPFFTDEFFNPSATYLAAKAVKKSIDNCRHNTASIVGARPAEIIFTAGGTEANNLAIQGVMGRYPEGNVVTSSIEHNSVLVPAGRYNTKIVNVDKYGRVGVAELEKLIDEHTVLVSVGLVNHELGVAQDMAEISILLRQIRNERKEKQLDLPLYLHTDAAQAGCYYDLNVARLGVDMMSVNGGKIYGPKQSGFLYVGAGVELSPILLGGGQENSIRSGTENVAAIHGLTVAFLEAQSSRKNELDRVNEINELFATKLQKIDKNILINSVAKHSSPHILNVTFFGADNERLMMELDEQGVMVALGSACSASSEEPSHVLKAIGLQDNDARSTLRFSFGRQTTIEEIDHAAEIIKNVVANTRKNR